MCVRCRESFDFPSIKSCRAVETFSDLQDKLIMNQDKLKKLQAQVRIGGKGTPRRKRKIVYQSNGTDDKKLQLVLKKLAVNQIPAIEEVNMIKNDGTIIHFNNPKAQASLAANTFAITGHSEKREVRYFCPFILIANI